MLRYGLTREEAEKKVEQIILNKKESNPYSIEGLMKRLGVTREEAESCVNALKKKTATGAFTSDTKWQMKRFGLTQEEAELKIKEAYQRRGKSTSIKKKENPESHFNTVEYWVSKGYSSEEASIKKAEHIENMQAAFHKELKNNPEKYKGRTPLQLDYWTNRGYSLEEAKELRKERQRTFSLEKCVQKYGKEEGLRIWNNRQEKWLIKLRENFSIEGDGRSPQSVWAKTIIKKCCKHLNIEVPTKEKWLSSTNGEFRCSYDFTHKHKIIEFNGDFWHAHPNLFNADKIIPVLGITAAEKWVLDEKKKKLAESHGYEVLVVWESDYHKGPEQIITECIKFLNN